MANSLHEEVFNFLEKYRTTSPDFYYSLRQRDRKNKHTNTSKLDEGIWFQGNESYAFVGLYTGSGGTNMTRSFGLVFYYDNQENKVLDWHLEIVYNEEKDDKIINFYHQAMQLLGSDFKEIKSTKYRKYFTGDDRLESVITFLNYEKPKIDQLVENLHLNKLFIKKNKFDKYLSKINKLRSSLLTDNSETETSTNIKTEIKSVKFPLNQILYGPPGTGKTYALSQIYFPEFTQTIKKNYQFTTFHQSFTYEDFVEGIKPVLQKETTNNDTSDIQYKLEKGIFYHAVDAACELAGFIGLQDCLNNYTFEERTTKFSQALPYALFIDEINRGNVSAILGELITLIEKDKRLTAQHELIVQLPYSKSQFALPPNLYIIGTMNTADRSVEALDTALRRRFSFKEYLPKPNLLKEIAEINLEKLLQIINRRIEKLLNKDYTIGHAYFMGLEESENPLQDLKTIFANKILPLLQEYFYGNFGKIQLIIGQDFFKTDKDKEKVTFMKSTFESADYEDRIVYRFKNIQEMEDEYFKQALLKIYTF